MLLAHGPIPCHLEAQILQCLLVGVACIPAVAYTLRVYGSRLVALVGRLIATL